MRSVEFPGTGPARGSGVVVRLHEAARGDAPAQGRESEERLALVSEAASEGLYDWNIADNALDVSPRLNRMFGFIGGDFDSRTWYARVHPEDRQTYRRALVALFKNETQRLSVEYRMTDVSGSYVWIQDNAVAVRNDAGRAVRLVGAVADISERKQAEAALRDSEQRYEHAMAAVNEGVYDWDIESGETYYSQWVYAALGLGEQDMRTAGDWLARIHPDDLPSYRQAIRVYFKGESERFEHEYRYRAADGSWHWARQRGLALRDDAGRAYRMIGSTGDITEEKRLAEALEATRRRLLDAVETVQEGFVVFDHEDRLVLCNSTYRRYFAEAAGPAVADMIVPGVCRFDYLAAAFEAGMYSHFDGTAADYVAQLRGTRGRRRAAQIGLSDGTWLQVDERAMRDGGYAAIFTDITEVKRRTEELADKSQTLERLSNQLSKYLSPQVYASIFAGDQPATVASRRKKLTVFFSDIADFTGTTEALESEELTALLNHYLTEMSKIALAHGATIDKFVGDAMMMFFGDPESRGVEADARACVAMAVAMQRRLRELEADWRDRGLEKPFRMRIGINTGYCTVGNFGSEDRMDYTIVGNEVNLAARLQACAEPGEIVLAHETRSLVRDEVAADECAPLRLKGFSKPIRTYKLRGQRARHELFERDAAGLRIRLDLSRLDRSAAVTALQQAIDRLNDDGHGCAGAADGQK